MAASTSKAVPAFGFLTVCEHQGQGLFGGYLVLNAAGRPLEFHCTAPVRASRAQEILYGPTLQPYLYGEQIGRTLLDNAKLKTSLVFTDVFPVLSLRDFIPCPVVLAVADEVAAGDQPDEQDEHDGKKYRLDTAHRAVRPPAYASVHTFQVGQQALAVPRGRESDVDEVTRCWHTLAADFDVREPFGRIREAIDEARGSAR